MASSLLQAFLTETAHSGIVIFYHFKQLAKASLNYQTLNGDQNV